ncbi:MAG: homoserine O-succinyltransferase [Defluviitaleaceae bacterium]|nr:homoserine O-succinyltransferase [Defluviitaleaceae bacterium]
MPVIVPNGLPAIDTLANENITVISESRAKSQDIRPLKIIILNLMPTKIATENQLIRVLSNTPLQVELTFLQTETHQSKNTPPEHLETFYQAFNDIRHACFDGLIVTGAPVETLAFEEVDYWEELCDILTWSKTHVFSTIHICWGAQAGLYFHHGIPKYQMDRKLSGIYRHQVEHPCHPLMRGFDETFLAPHSRHTEIRVSDLEQKSELEVLSMSPDAGVYLVATKDFRQIYLTGHPEYDAETLNLEYLRDVARGLNPEPPVHYFSTLPGQSPQNRWRGHAYLLFGNWLNDVYQKVPYDIEQIKNISHR